MHEVTSLEENSLILRNHSDQTNVDIMCPTPPFKAYTEIGAVVNPIVLRKAKIAYNFGLSECNTVKGPKMKITEIGNTVNPGNVPHLDLHCLSFILCILIKHFLKFCRYNFFEAAVFNGTCFTVEKISPPPSGNQTHDHCLH